MPCSTIPINIDFVIHRQGEWTMLMLGESVLSLLITDGLGRDYLGVFYAGIMTVILLQLLHFRSQPHDPSVHAMRRHKNAGVTFGFVFALYSAALVAVGVSYKLLLYGVQAADDGEDDKKTRALFAADRRWLAPASGGDDGCGPTKAELKEMVAHLFSSMLAIVFVCQDLMVLLHRGLSALSNRCNRKSVVCKTTGAATTVLGTNVKGILFAVLPRVATTIFVASLSFWQQNPRTLAELGCVAVLVQLATRLLGDVFLPDHNQHGNAHHHHHHDGIEDEDSIIDDSYNQ